MKRIFDEFEQVRIINLQERADRRRAVIRELARIGVEEIVPPISFYTARRLTLNDSFESGPKGSLISHREAIREAVASGARNLLVLEDDVFFNEPHPGQIDAIINAIRERSWDIIYFGYLKPDDVSLNGPLARWTGGTIGGHFYGMNRPYMEKMLAFMDSFGKAELGMETTNPSFRDGAFNLYFERNPELNRFLVAPSLARQRSSRTDLHRLSHFDRIPGLRDLTQMTRALRNFIRRR
ncbi:MAG: hypothetical protein ACE5FO_02210 [Parvularculaceae bacterium]